jgi:hypothetical protein
LGDEVAETVSARHEMTLVNRVDEKTHRRIRTQTGS